MPNTKSKVATDIKTSTGRNCGNVLAIKNNKVILNESTGYANISKVRNTPKTAFSLIQSIKFYWYFSYETG